MFIYLNQAISQIYYLFNLKNLKQLFCSLITKSVGEICVIPHCVFLKIASAGIPHESGVP